jgi:uncharacterized protein (DUF2062 family)
MSSVYFISCDFWEFGSLMKKFVRNRILMPLQELLLEGLTPNKVALSLALGFACGVYPMLGATTILCLVVGGLFGLNHLAMQLVNYFAYPLQILLVIPQLRLGEFLLNASPLRMSLHQIARLVYNEPRHSVSVLGISLLHAIVGWFVVSAIAVPILYFAFFQVLKRIPLKQLRDERLQQSMLAPPAMGLQKN